MGVDLVRSLQPPDILWIHWRVYNSIANTSKRVFFLPPSAVYVRSFLYLLYTLIKLYYTKKKRKDPDTEKDWRQEEKGMIENEMVGWHHQLSGHEFEQTPGDGEGQESHACFSPWGHKESDTTEWANNNIERCRYMSGQAWILCLCLSPKQSQFHPNCWAEK